MSTDRRIENQAPNAVQYQVKGSSLRTKFDFVKARFGEAAARDLATEFAADIGVVPLDSKWYPFALFQRLLAAIVDRFFDGDTARLVEVGEDSASRSLSSTYSAFALRDFPQFLERIASLHSRFYNLGTMTVRRGAAATSCEIVLSGAPSYPLEDLLVAQGFYVGAAKHFGLANVRCSRRSDGRSATFTLSWDAARV